MFFYRLELQLRTFRLSVARIFWIPVLVETMASKRSKSRGEGEVLGLFFRVISFTGERQFFFTQMF